MRTVAIIDYDAGNLDSVKRAVEECGARPVIAGTPADLAQATHIILPGVGAFADGMRHLRERHWEEALSEQVVGKQIPFLGICLGMQLMAAQGSEGGDTRGLGWIRGEVRRFDARGSEERIPHVGWNEVEPAAGCPLFRQIPEGADFYFVHSYHVVCEEPGQALGQTSYCGGFTSVIGQGAMFGVQFHPEKSQKAGFQLLRNFLAL